MATRKKPVTRRDHSSIQTFLEYTCLVSGQILVDEVCPWHAVDDLSATFYYADPIRRLATLSKNSGSYSNHAPTIHE